MFTVKIIFIAEENGIQLFKNISCLRLRKETADGYDGETEFKNISCLRLR